MFKSGLPSVANPAASRQLRQRFRKSIPLLIMLLIPMAILFIFKYMPMYGVQIAFRDYRPALGIWGSPWVGLKYLSKFFNYYNFWNILRNTFIINLYNLISFPLSLIFALMLNYALSSRYRKIVQMVSYAPHFISTVIMCTMIVQFLNAKTGMINGILGLFGVDAVNYMARSEYFYHIYVWSDIWQQLGYSSIIYIAALAGISPELHEAAIVDGASVKQRVWHIDIPGVMPTFSILIILRCGMLLTLGYEKTLLLQNNLNLSVSQVISTYAYQIGIAAEKPQYSYSAAISLFSAVVNMVLLFVVNKTVKKLSGTSVW
jgi:putative aldouronate transport system permease protein